MVLYANDSNYRKSKLFVSQDLRNKMLAGGIFKKIKDTTLKGLKKLKNLVDLKNDIIKKGIDKVSNNETLMNVLEGIPVVGQPLASTIKTADKIVKKLDNIENQVKNGEYDSTKLKEDMKQLWDNEQVKRGREMLYNWFDTKVKGNEKLDKNDKEQIKENIDNLDVQEVFEQLGDKKAPLAGLLVSPTSKTLKKKWREALNIPQKTIKHGRLYLSGGEFKRLEPHKKLASWDKKKNEVKTYMTDEDRDEIKKLKPMKLSKGFEIKQPHKKLASWDKKKNEVKTYITNEDREELKKLTPKYVSKGFEIKQPHKKLAEWDKKKGKVSTYMTDEDKNEIKKLTPKYVAKGIKSDLYNTLFN